MLAEGAIKFDGRYLLQLGEGLYPIEEQADATDGEEDSQIEKHPLVVDHDPTKDQENDRGTDRHERLGSYLLLYVGATLDL